MRIMQIIPAFGVGGAETMCENLVYELMNMGHKVIVVSLYDEDTMITKRMKERGVKILYLHKKRGIDFLLIFRLRKLIKKIRPDVVHTHLYALKYAFFSKLFLKIKGVHTMHSVAEMEASLSDQRINKVIYRLKSFIPVSLSEEVQKSVCKIYKLSKSQTPIVFNGVDLSRCIIKHEYKTGEIIRIIHVGRFSEPKNHKCIINCFERLPKNKYHLDLWGDGELIDEIKEMVEKRGLTKEISFRGTTDNIYPELNAADIFILPSKWEGMPMTIIEAMGTGLPIIASAVGGVGEMISDGIDGILIQPTSKDLCDAIERLANSCDERRRLGFNAKPKSTKFSSKAMACDYLKIYQGA